MCLAQARAIKQLVTAILPDLTVWLDVDDMPEHGIDKLEDIVGQTQLVLVFLSGTPGDAGGASDYFSSRCIRLLDLCRPLEK